MCNGCRAGSKLETGSVMAAGAADAAAGTRQDRTGQDGTWETERMGRGRRMAWGDRRAGGVVVQWTARNNFSGCETSVLINRFPARSTCSTR